MGLIAALLSTIFVTAKDVASKRLASRVDGTVSAFASFFFALPYYAILLAVMYGTGLETFTVKSGFYVFIIFRSLSDTLAEWMKMHALTEGDLSVVTSFLSLYPVILLFTSPLITGDPLPPGAIYSTLVIVAGTLLLVYQPRSSEKKIPVRSLFLALGAAFFFSINTSLDRMAAQTGSPVFSGFLMTLLAGVFLTGPLIRRPGWRPALVQNTGGFLYRGFWELAFMVSKLYALTVLPAPYLVAITRISLLFSIIGGKLVFKEEDFTRRFVAGIAICGGVIWMLLAGK